MKEGEANHDPSAPLRELPVTRLQRFVHGEEGKGGGEDRVVEGRGLFGPGGGEGQGVRGPERGGELPVACVIEDEAEDLGRETARGGEDGRRGSHRRIEPSVGEGRVNRRQLSRVGGERPRSTTRSFPFSLRLNVDGTALVCRSAVAWDCSRWNCQLSTSSTRTDNKLCSIERVEKDNYEE